jgi:hypothetical protein
LGLRVARQRGENRTVTGLRATLLWGAVLAVTAPSAHAALSWDTASHDFGGHNVGTSTSRTFTMTATCDAPDPIDPPFCGTPVLGTYNFGTPSVTGTGFALGSPNTCSTGILSATFVGSMATCTSTVIFAPTATGAHTGSLTTPTGPDIALSGTGVAAPASPAPGATGSPGTQPGKKCKKRKGKKGAAAAKKCKKKKG